MSHTLTASDAFDTVTVPDDGEAAVATAPGVPASRVTLEEVIQNLANRDEWLRTSLNGHCEVLPTIRFESGVLGVYISQITGLHLGGQRLSTTLTTYVALSLATGWWHLYARNNAGSIAFEVSATGPEEGLVFKSGDTSRRFLCSFLWVSGAGAGDFVKVGRRVEWRRVGALITGPAALADYVLDSAGVDLIPPHVSLVHFRLTFQTAGQVRVRPYGSLQELTFDSSHGPAVFSLDVRRNGAGKPVFEHESLNVVAPPPNVSFQYEITGYEE